MVEPHENDFYALLSEMDNEAPSDGHMPLPIVRASELARKPSSPRKWVVEGLIPSNAVTFLSGDGGTGKSLLSIQLGVAIVSNRSWLGKKCANGPVVYVAAEDDGDEIQRRLQHICSREGIRLEELTEFYVILLTDRAATFAVQDGGGIRFNELFRQVAKEVRCLNPRLVIFDPLAAFFAGEDMNRAAATQFVRGVAQELAGKDTGVLVIAHPSVDAMRSGRPMAGSTGWANAARAVLSVELLKKQASRRKISLVKTNYAAGTAMVVDLDDGIFIHVKDEQMTDENTTTDRLFLSLLRDCEDRGVIVSPRPGKNYAPAKFAEMPMAKERSISNKGLQDSMERLLRRGAIAEQIRGSESRKRKKLVIIPSLTD